MEYYNLKLTKNQAGELIFWIKDIKYMDKRLKDKILGFNLEI